MISLSSSESLSAESEIISETSTNPVEQPSPCVMESTKIKTETKEEEAEKQAQAVTEELFGPRVEDLPTHAHAMYFKERLLGSLLHSRNAHSLNHAREIAKQNTRF